jgi:hypothetical protein
MFSTPLATYTHITYGKAFRQKLNSSREEKGDCKLSLKLAMEAYRVVRT